MDPVWSVRDEELLAQTPALQAQLARWVAWEGVRLHTEGRSATLLRVQPPFIQIEISDVTAAAEPLEDRLRAGAEWPVAPVCVRTTVTRARALDLPAAPDVLRAAVADAGWAGDPGQGVRLQDTLRGIAGLQMEEEGRTLESALAADLMFVPCGPSGSDPSMDLLPDVHAALTTLSRLCERRSVRVLVLVLGPAADAVAAQRLGWARRLATRLVLRGGPAVLLLPSDASLGDFLAALTHSRSIRMAFAAASFHPAQSRADAGAFSLWTGGGRDDLLRAAGHAAAHVSTPTASDVIVAPAIPASVRLPPLGSFPRSYSDADEDGRTDRGSGPRFQPRSDDGSVLRSAAIEDAARTQPGPDATAGDGPDDVMPPTGGGVDGRDTPQAAAPAGAAGRSDAAAQARYVDMQLGSARDATPVREPLRVGALYQLAVWIGHDKPMATWGARALIDPSDPARRFPPGMDALPLEIAVTPIDFVLHGEAVQEVLLPRNGDSARVCFALTAKGDSDEAGADGSALGIARVRVSVFHRNHLLQSFLLVARCVSADGTPADAIEEAAWAARMAAALRIAPSDVPPGAAWLSRLEFATTKAIAVPADGAAAWTRPRALSILANDSLGEPVITIKGRDGCIVRIAGDLKQRVANLRAALGRAMTSADGKRARFAAGPTATQGSEEELRAALIDLAAEGWALFDSLVPGRQRADLRRQLEGTAGGDASSEEAQTIQVAHMLLDRVVPWAALYDRKFDRNCQRDADGNPVEQTACTAALPDEAGRFPTRTCGQSPGCVLHPDRLAERKTRGLPLPLPETVACPLHFWGFRHRIELPVQQVHGGAGAARDVATRIAAAAPVRMAIGVNPTLALSAQHSAALRALVTSAAGPPVTVDVDQQRSQILQRLENEGLDLVYLYCHAYAADEDQKYDPFLTFSAPADATGRVTASQFDSEHVWAHAPLVILNACSSLGFAPDALSPFIAKFVEDRGAAGVLGTEARVWEGLAGEVGLGFVGRILRGVPAGEALRLTRLSLLRQRNPLGLLYTLYASADLRLEGAVTTGRGVAGGAGGGV